MAENKNKSKNLSNINEKLIAILSNHRNVLPDNSAEICFLII
jgi:hypothetical protein